MGTSWLRMTILPESSPFDCLRLRGAYISRSKPVKKGLMLSGYGQSLPAIVVERMVNYLAQLEGDKEPPPEQQQL
jgi:hypothetical protein